jgi:hypothetical protein
MSSWLVCKKMKAVWLLSISLLSICLQIRAQELINSTANVTESEVETAGRVGYWRNGVYYRASTPSPPRTQTRTPNTPSTWTRKCSGTYAVGCVQCSFWSGSCTQCNPPNYVLGASGQCKCARGYYNPYIGKRKASKSTVNSVFYDKSHCAPCPAGNQCTGGVYWEAVREPKACSTKGYKNGWTQDCTCQRGFTQYKGECGEQLQLLVTAHEE